MASSSNNSRSATLWRGKDNQTTYPQLSWPAMTPNFNSSETLWMAKGKGKDIENGLQKEHDEKHDHGVDPSTVTWRERLKHFTFAWYACTMSTGGVAFVMSVVPNRFEAMTAIGTGMFIFNLFLFTIITATMITRFVMHPGTLTHSLTNPHEGFFFATFWLSLATMITNTTAYGIPNSGPWLIVALRIAFWVYTVCATILAIVYYHVLFTVKKLVITNVLPGWVLPIFPAMLVGTLASAITKTQPIEHALPMLVAGLSFQGLGMMVAVMMYGLYFGSLLTSGLPIDMSRPAMFIAVGPPSFTALAFIGMAQDVVATRIFETYIVFPGIINQNLIPDALQLLALLSSIFLWTLAFWFFAIATIAAIEAIQRNDFHLNWYAYVFPNVGFTIATIKIGERLGSNAIQLVGTGMAGVLFFLWLLIAFCHVKAIINRQICWPGKDEDAH
jgi:C4-dicarboxylate transporter/malic acid transport protein